jgi:hypothetical protein
VKGRLVPKVLHQSAAVQQALHCVPVALCMFWNGANQTLVAVCLSTNVVWSRQALVAEAALSSEVGEPGLRELLDYHPSLSTSEVNDVLKLNRESSQMISHSCCRLQEAQRASRLESFAFPTDGVAWMLKRLYSPTLSMAYGALLVCHAAVALLGGVSTGVLGGGAVDAANRGHAAFCKFCAPALWRLPVCFTSRHRREEVCGAHCLPCATSLSLLHGELYVHLAHEAAVCVFLVGGWGIYSWVGLQLGGTILCGWS